MRKANIILIFCSIVISWMPILAQTPATPFENEVSLGLTFRRSILAERTELTEGPEVRVSQSVFQTLINTSFVRQGDPFPYRLTLLEGSIINASSYAGGQILAEGGLVSLLKDSPGLWAAVLGHEIAHTRSHHQYNAYLRYVNLQEQIEYYRRRAAAGDQSANWALLGLGIGGGIINKKLSRNDELEADRLGMFIMAEAGYHPDFAISCYRRIAFKTGDQSKLSAFFADHPRWVTREQRALKAYSDALAIFDSRWADVDESPGGRPPVIATLNNIRSKKDQSNKVAVITASLNVRNAKGLSISCSAIFHVDGKPVPSVMNGLKTSEGHLIAGIKGKLTTLDETGTIEIRVPTEAIGTKHRKLKSYLVVFGPDGEVLYTSDEFSVSFPN